jgi:hypothetical protein
MFEEALGGISAACEKYNSIPCLENVQMTTYTFGPIPFPQGPRPGSCWEQELFSKRLVSIPKKPSTQSTERSLSPAHISATFCYGDAYKMIAYLGFALNYRKRSLLADLLHVVLTKQGQKNQQIFENPKKLQKNVNFPGTLYSSVDAEKFSISPTFSSAVLKSWYVCSVFSCS